MILLLGTTDSLTFTTSTAATLDWWCSYVDTTTSTTTAGSAQGQVSSATSTTAAAAPGSGVTRKVLGLSFVNKHATLSVQIVVKRDVSGLARALSATYTLAPGDQLVYTDLGGWKQITTPAAASSASYPLWKVGATMEAAAIHTCLGLSSGHPGAWSPGSPGLNGRTTDGTNSNDAGCVPVPTPASGSSYLTKLLATCTAALAAYLMDVLWVNTGLVVTTTTAQAITTPTLPSRDDNGATAGAGVLLGLLVTTATTNAGAVTTITASYTNSAGTSGRTATMASFPATAVAGSIVWFQLAAGDTGVRSVESITLGTTLAGGAVSVILARWYPMVSVGAANVAGSGYDDSGGVRLWAGCCLLPVVVPTATTAVNFTATAVVTTR